jgi:hypothetical protein
MIASQGARVLNANERGNGLLVTVDYGAPTVLVERFLSAEITAIFADSALWVAIGIRAARPG